MAFFLVMAWAGGAGVALGQWPMLRGNAQHTGLVEGELPRPARLAWAREIDGERLGTAVEPILSGGRLLVATHQGRLYALKAQTGEPEWVFQAHGPFLHSPATAEGVVVAGCADGHLYGLEADTGKLRWRLSGGRGGFSAAPTIEGGAVFIGTRGGRFLAVDAATGEVRWRHELNAPIRQTAAVKDGHVFVTAEDLRVRCFSAGEGKELWTSEPLAGQTARDYYPVVVKQGEQTFVVVRTNPILNMGRQIGGDRTMLCRNAGVDDSGWQKVDAWTKSEAARGTPELWAREQQAIAEYLQTNQSARTFFVLDAVTGKQMAAAPVLWVGGCQGVGAQPALARDGRLLVFYRSAYGNWNHGVAPLVALGLLDLAKNEIKPLFHQQGKQPRWNCFWGTADESQNFVMVGSTVVIVHQGTLSGFDLENNELFAIAGERDTYGGFRNPRWARNEWHGPARAGVAVSDGRVYWQTGSRLLCFAVGAGEAAKPQSLRTNGLRLTTAPPLPAVEELELKRQLNNAVEQVLSRTWAPLFTEPGLAGRDFAFDHSGALFESLAWAYPHLNTNLQTQVLARLEEEWMAHPPLKAASAYALEKGAAREWFPVPPDYRTRPGRDSRPHAFGNLYALWLFAERCSQHAWLEKRWPEVKKAFDDFIASGWKLDGARGHLHANRYLASLLAMVRLAERAGQAEVAAQAEAMADQTVIGLLGWWHRTAEQGTLRTFHKTTDLDPFISRGDGLSLAVAPHRHKLALFHDLTPEVAQLLRARADRSVTAVWHAFETLYCTWPLMGEERQVHFGENFVDPPDLALAAFKASAWLRETDRETLARQVDLPFCKADLAYVTKLSLCLR